MSRTFQRELHENLVLLEGVKAIADNILVYGEGDTDSVIEQNRNKRILAMLEGAQETGMKSRNSGIRSKRYIGH